TSRWDPKSKRDEVKNVVETFGVACLQINALRCRPPSIHEISAKFWLVRLRLNKNRHFVALATFSRV
ncbi:MAG: hypothetical protein WBW41_02855, partial [Verrucomicrobiia bacterium]